MVARGSPKTRQRRAKGEGAIYQRPDGRWVGELLHGWENGERKRKYVYGRTRPEVVAKLDRVRRAHAQGEPLTPERLTVAVFLLDWADQTLVLSGKAPRSIQRQASVVKSHLAPYFSKHRLAKLTPASVQAYVTFKAREKTLDGKPKNAPASIRLHVTTLRRALNSAVRQELIGRNPVSGIELPALSHKERTVLDQAQAWQFLQAAQGDRLEALWVLLLTTGLRIGEATALEWPDLNLACDLTRAVS